MLHFKTHHRDCLKQNSTDIAKIEQYSEVNWEYRKELMRKAEEKEKTQVQYKLPVIQVPAKEVAEVLESSKVSTSFRLPSLFSSLYNDNDDNDA